MKLILIAFVFFYSATAWAKTLTLEGYKDKEGAITVLHDGNVSDPYFTAKSLLIAHQSGWEIDRIAQKWIEWNLKNQDEEGRLPRMCQSGGPWYNCAEADADDIALTLWIELIYTISDYKVPTYLEPSLNKAESHLDKLYDRERGIYIVSLSQPTGLLMDNVEIYASLKNISREQYRLGLNGRAWFTELRAKHLHDNILKVFFNESTKQFNVSTQTRQGNDFYPDKVAQIFPLMYGLQPQDKAKKNYRKWITSYRKEWLSMEADHYPWALVALAALQYDDVETAKCWLKKASVYRDTSRWNVLEEVIFQVITSHPGAKPPQEKSC